MSNGKRLLWVTIVAYAAAVCHSNFLPDRTKVENPPIKTHLPY